MLVRRMKPTQLIEVYNCLCDETRLRIVHLLAQAPLCVCHLQDILGLSQVTASKHLSYLRKRGLVESRRHGQWMIYALPSECPRELDWQLRCLQDCLTTHKVFRNDLRKLKAQRSDSCWVSQVIKKPTHATRNTAPPKSTSR